LYRQKLLDIFTFCYPAVKTASSYMFIRFDTITARDGPTDRNATANTALSIAARSKNCYTKWIFRVWFRCKIVRKFAEEWDFI